jgi:hypoxanthine phosphoribosyltransferase
MAYRIYRDGFVPDVIYASMRGGAYLANVISEYFKIARKDERPVFYAAVVSHSYSDIHEHDRVQVYGWTYPPEYLRAGDKVLLVDDIFDSGNTINCLVDILLTKGVPRNDIKVAVHDYKHFIDGPAPLPIQPDYWCRKFDINTPEDNCWIHYMSHELIGLTHEELEEHYYKADPDLREALSAIL